MKHICSCSFGKDSIATIILAHENNIPIDLIVFSEVMFDKNISGENPEHIKFIYDRAIPKFKEWGYKVKVLRSDRTYMDCFYHKIGRSKYPERVGKVNGFVISGLCMVNRDCKLKPIKEFNKTLEKGTVTYIGIAFDEPKRLERLKENQISILANYQYTEKMAYNLCKKYNLLSPIYENSSRGGCWFCPNAKTEEFAKLKKDYPEYWEKLKIMDNCRNKTTDLFCRNKTLKRIEADISAFDNQTNIFDFIDDDKQ